MAQIEVRLSGVRQRRLPPYVDFGPFFLFFGISGTDHGREERLRRRFERETYRHLVTLGARPALPPGRYRLLQDVPASVGKRVWTADDATLRGELSEGGLEDLRDWLRGGRRVVEAAPVQ